MPFDANGNWYQANDPGMGYTQGGSMYPNAGVPIGPPPGTAIPVTPGDPTHGGMFDASGAYLGPQQNSTANNPFAYTDNSLLTPYNQQFSYPNVPSYTSPQGQYGQAPPSSTGGGGGDLRSQVIALANQSGRPDIAANPDYWVQEIAGKGQGPGGVNGPIDTGYWGNRFATANQGGGGGGYGTGGLYGVSPMAPMQFGSFSYSPQQVGGVSAPTPFSNPNQPFSFGSYADPQQYNSQQFSYGAGPGQQLPPGFTAPTLTNTNDPGYAFRISQGQQQIQNMAAAQGARGGDVMQALQDYTQNTASSEYGNVFQRALSGYQAQLAGQQQGYGQAFNTSALNNQTAQQAAAFNEQNRLAAYGANWNTASGVYDRNFQNALSAYQTNAQNQMQAAALTEQAQAANAQLGWQAASGVYDRNYQNALNSYQMQWNQQMQAAGLGLQQAQFGMGAQGQGFNQALTSYGTNAAMFQTNQANQYNRLYGSAQMGQNSANSLNTAAGNYSNAYGNIVTGQGNAGAAGTVGGANAWGGAFGNIGNMAGAYGMYYGGINPSYSYRPTPVNPGFQNNYSNPPSPAGYGGYGSPQPNYGGGYNA